jgi:hypothetical protein
MVETDIQDQCLQRVETLNYYVSQIEICKVV